MSPKVPNVYLYLPNLIGYTRVILSIASFWYIRRPELFLILYSTSCILDAFDGHAARYLNQCSLFGAVLDMVTDRSTTAGLLCFLGLIYPNWLFLFQLLIGLDLSSHYMQMYSSLSSGSSSHKNIKSDQSFILRIYYTSRVALFIACALNELFFLSLYCLHYKIGSIVSVAGYTFDTTLFIAALSAPVCALKQTINCIQLAEASRQLVGIDQKKCMLVHGASDGSATAASTAKKSN